MKTIDTNALSTVTGGLNQANQLMFSQMQSLTQSLAAAQNPNNNANNNLTLALVMGLAMRNSQGPF
jgi:bacteriocin-like protein